MKAAYGSFLGTVAAISLVLVSSGCQTTAEKSAELRKLQKHEVLAVTGVSVKSENPSVRVLYSAVVGSQEGATAIVVGVRNTSSHALRSAPIEVTAKDGKGERRLPEHRSRPSTIAYQRVAAGSREGHRVG